MAPEHSPCARALACALALLTAGRAYGAAAELYSADMAAGDPQAPLELYLNGGQHDTIPVILHGDDALVPVDDLEAAGLRGFEGQRVNVGGRIWVSLKSLAPAVRFVVDDRALAIRIDAERNFLGTSAIDMRPTTRPPGLVTRGDPSGFFNYSAQLRTNNQFSGFAEAGASRGGKLLYSSGQILPGGQAVRGLSNLTIDDVPSLRRLVVGDSFAGSSGLGGGLLLGGLSLSREYSLDPYRLRSPLPRLSGFASTPSTLDVYVNGVLTRQVPLSPGGYDVSNLPVSTGAGNVQTVLRDAFGRTETLQWQYYYTSGLLAPGLSDYGYSLGFRRLGYGTESFDYGRPVFLGRHRLGVADWLTLGGRLEGAQDLVSGGPAATFGLPFGTLELEAGASGQTGKLGTAASAGYSFVSRAFSAGTLLRFMSDRYAHASLQARNDRPRIQASLYGGAPILPRLSVGLNYSVLDYRDVGLTDSISAHADLLLLKNVTLGVVGSRSRQIGGATAYDLFATLSWAFAPMSVADVSVQAGGSGSSVSAGAQQGLPAGTGFGYRARATSGEGPQTASGVLQYQWDYGRYELQYDRVGASGTGTATVAGGAVYIGDRLFLSRPVQDGYGLIRVGVPGVRGYAEGQEIGRTDGRGDLLVPSLLPYYGNRLSIADRDIPIAYRIGSTEQLAAPTLHGGALARFGVDPLRIVSGEMYTVVGGQEVSPAYGDMAVRTPAGPVVSPVGGDGAFYLEGVPPGRHQAEVEWSRGRCRLTLVIPEGPAIVELGRVLCEAEADTSTIASTPAPASTATATATPIATPAPAATPTSTPVATAISAPTPTPPTPTATPAPPATRTAKRVRSAAATARRAPPAIRVARPAPPAKPLTVFPAKHRTDLGPRSRGCPTCGVCVDAALERTYRTPPLSPADEDVLAQALRTRNETAQASTLPPDPRELCQACLRIRLWRHCASREAQEQTAQK